MNIIGVCLGLWQILESIYNGGITEVFQWGYHEWLIQILDSMVKARIPVDNLCALST
jgi:hypothetical protein